MIVIVDYGMGNLRSVQKAFERCGSRAVVSGNPREILKADKVVLPGVGAFAHAVEELRRRKLIEPIREQIARGRPYLGICLGMQLLFDDSLEGSRTRGFGIVGGTVTKFKGSVKIPQIGWNQVRLEARRCPLFKGVSSDSFFYFVHSYYGDCIDSSWVSAVTDYGGYFCSALWRANVFATQFHPEKSQKTGLKLIRNFIKF
ncbi:MAG: imidazole glycerol phosphate synthase subunit HisH [Candidatus Omnitrophota bacterium]